MKKKVLIIGAGISGLYLAYLLQDKYDVTILEARDRIGGRVFSIDSHDLGPSWIWPHHTHMLQLLKEFHLELFEQYTKGYALYDAKEEVQLFAQPQATSFRVQGSLSALIQRIALKLHSTTLLLSTEVKQIKHSQDGVVVSTFEKDFQGDFVISTLPPRITTQLEFFPALPTSLYTQMQNTQTWMGNSMKCVIEFAKPFWRERGLSGFMFSNRGPIAEMHDASTKNKAALFGFVHSNASLESFKEDVTQQLIRVFGIEKESIVNIYFIDWKKERFTSSKEDSKPLSTHPKYGIDTSKYSERIFFSSTEFSYQEGGYLEGAIRNAQKIAQSIS